MNCCPDADRRLRVRRHFALGGTIAFLLAVAGLVLGGCGTPASSPSDNAPQQTSRHKAKVTDELLHHAIDALYRLEEFEGGEMLQRTIDRLDQWAHEQKPLADWQPDAMIATLPKELAELPAVKDLGKLEFEHADGLALQEAVWLRDASNWTKGDDVTDVARGKALFDWTVRNIQLERDRGTSSGSEHILQTPWETLVLGRGTAWERAWVFLLLARQQALNAFILGLPEAEASDKVTPWAVALLSEGELYLFDPAMGFPIPGPGGVQLGEDGQLDIKPATLSQLRADDALVRQLDVDGEHPYPVKSAQLENVVGLLEASPSYLEQKMAMIEARLVGSERMVLTSSPSAQAERLKATQQVKDVRLWTMPYDVLAQRQRLGDQVVRWQQAAMLPFQAGQSPVLWKGRVLHIKGVLTGDTNATTYYQTARPSDREVAAAGLPRQLQSIYLLAKLDASYWLGLIAYEQGSYPSAIDYLSNRTLLKSENGPWNGGAHYNLGRIHEAQHNYARALEMYRITSNSPDHSGNLLRARWLESATGGKTEPPTPTTPEAEGHEKKPAEEMPALPTLPSLPEEKPKDGP